MPKKTSLATEFPKTILPALAKQLNCQNRLACPRIVKVKIATSFGKIARKGGSSNAIDETIVKKITQNIALICGQKPRAQKSRIAVSNFKLRKGMLIGLAATLRQKRALDFIAKLNAIALPRVRDFHGISPKGFDGHGNYSLGLRDCTVFPEIKPDENVFSHGLEITVVTSAQDDRAGKTLLTALGFPFQK